MELRLLSLCVGHPKVIAHINGGPVLSGIAKQPVTRESVFVGTTNIEGDSQADLTVHGGADKAVYAYSADNWPWWEHEQMQPCAPNTFGENLTLEGADETQVAIGDRFRWGDAELEICQPRGPCYKLALHTQRANTPAIMTISARSGWYFRVTREGEAKPHGALTRIHASTGPSVRDAFVAVYHPRIAESLRRAVYEAPELAENWKFAVAKRLHPA
jgi:MOSC domain-containing protein YiiM